jgi:hypothetical protein
MTYYNCPITGSEFKICRPLTDEMHHLKFRDISSDVPFMMNEGTFVEVAGDKPCFFKEQTHTLGLEVFTLFL